MGTEFYILFKYPCGYLLSYKTVQQYNILEFDIYVLNGIKGPFII